MDDRRVAKNKPKCSASHFNTSAKLDSTLSAERLNMGSLVYVRYQDHAIFRNMYPDMAKPIVQEAWGQLDHDDPEYIRLIVARYQEPEKDGKQAAKATGLVIVKSTILEIHKVA
jgi:hypothetical protein